MLYLGYFYALDDYSILAYYSVGIITLLEQIIFYCIGLLCI